MKFFSRELSERLASLGCKSESGYFWVLHSYSNTWVLHHGADIGAEHLTELKIFAFYQKDFTGCHPQARENAKIAWGKFNVVFGACHICINNKLEPAYLYHRKKMIDAPDAEKYLEETMR